MKLAPQTLEQQQAEALSRLRGQVAVRLSAALRQGSAATLAAIAELETLVDRNIQAINVNASKVRQQGVMIPVIACRRGCSYCCHGRVGASIPEVLRIAHYLRRTLNSEALEQFLDRAQAHLAQFEGMNAYARSVHSTPCPFLGPQSECTIHSVRPIACRTHHSLDLDACKQAFDDAGKKGVPQITQHATLTQPVVEGIELASRSAHLRPRHVDLFRALVLALKTDAEDRWLQGEDAFEEAEDKGLLMLAAQSRR